MTYEGLGLRVCVLTERHSKSEPLFGLGPRCNSNSIPYTALRGPWAPNALHPSLNPKLLNPASGLGYSGPEPLNPNP